MYDTAFYDLVRPGIVASAAALVPVLHGLIRPSTVVDVGCGEGHWLARFKEHGCTVVGLDSGETSPGQALEPSEYRHVNLAGSWSDGLTADLVVCLEVAEHLPAGAASRFVAQLCKVAPVVVFSAAVPGQGGVGHLNERWQSWWAGRFRAHGFAVSGAARRLIWGDDRIEVWYRQNLLICADPGRAPAPVTALIGEEDGIVDVVHPVLWESRR